MCHVQNGSNNEPSGAHMRHMTSCHKKEIYVRWIKDKVKSRSTNEGLTCGNRKDNSLDPCLTNQFWRGDSKLINEGEKRRDFRERVSTFSLDFPTIGPSNSGETIGKVDPHCKSYTWVPVLWNFGNSRR